MKALTRILTVLLGMSILVTAADQPRVFITDSQSWEISGGWGGSSGAFGGGVKGGARPQKAEIIKTFGEKCTRATINNKPEKADYVVLLDHEGGKGWIRKDNKVAVFNSDGDSIVSKSTRSLGGSVETACESITKDWASGGAERAAAAQQKNAAAGSTTAAAPADAKAKVEVQSEPTGADIEVDGAFMGNTPSVLELPPGEHVITVTKPGYKTWERKLKLTGGSVKLNPQLETSQ